MLPLLAAQISRLNVTTDSWPALPQWALSVAMGSAVLSYSEVRQSILRTWSEPKALASDALLFALVQPLWPGARTLDAWCVGKQ